MSFLSGLFGADKEQERQRELDAKLNDLNNRDYAPGGVIYEHIADRDGKEAADRAMEQVSQHQSITYAGTSTIPQQVDDAFNEGLRDGFGNVTGGINSALKLPFQFAWKSIPWQLWLTGLIVAYFYLGGFKKFFK